MLGLLSITNLEAKKVKKLQVLVDSQAPNFLFAMNIGGSIIDGTLAAFAPRPVNALFISNGLIYKGDTIDTKNQSSFLVDKKGNLLTASNSIGQFLQISNVLLNYTLTTPPAMGTPVNFSKYVFDFKKHHDGPDHKRILITEGFLVSQGVAAPNQVGYTGTFAELGGTKENQEANHAIKVKLVPDQSLLALVINVEIAAGVHVKL
jgi:hypothetical protein